MDKDILPTFAKSILIAKGLGFEKKGFDEQIWQYFFDQYHHIQCDRKQR